MAKILKPCRPGPLTGRFLKHALGKLLRALLLALACGGAARADAVLQLFNLSWNEVAGKMPEIAEAGYKVFSTLAVSLPFTPLSGTIIALGGTATYTNPAPASVQRYYRVEVWP
jgi:hypothetical protein